MKKTKIKKSNWFKKGTHGAYDDKKKRWYTVPNCEICDGLLFVEALDDPKIKRHASLTECVGSLHKSLEHSAQIIDHYARSAKKIMQELKKSEGHGAGS